MTNEVNQDAEESQAIEKTAVEQTESNTETAQSANAPATGEATAAANAPATETVEAGGEIASAEAASSGDTAAEPEVDPVEAPKADATDAGAEPAVEAETASAPAETPATPAPTTAPSTAQYRTITVSKPIRVEPEPPAPTPAKAKASGSRRSAKPAEAGDDSATGDIDFGAILEQFEQEQTVFHVGELVEGKVVGISDRGILVDFGYKSEGYVPVEEFTGPGGEMLAEVGQNVEVTIRNISGDGAPQLSRIDALGRKVWDEIEAAFNAETPITGRVIDKTKGGIRIDINGVEAFMPGSQVDSRPVRGLDSYLGQDIEAQVIKFSRRRSNIVLSRKVITDKVEGVKKAETLGKIEIGYIVDGTIKNLTEYGAFVDIGGIDGLLHVTDMSSGRIAHPGALFKVGDHVQVKVLKLDREREKVSLGYKQLLPDPWSTVVEVYQTNSKVKGTVSSVTDYGVFVELEPGVEGLVHVSEISWARRAQSPKRLFQKNQEVEVQVLGVDTLERRISLGMKQFQENPWDFVDLKFPVGSKVRGKVRNLTDFGAFVELEEGIDGLVHVSDITWAKKIKHPKDVLKKDQEVEAIVTSIDKRGQRLSLSMKDLTPSAWEGYVATHRPGDVVRGKVSRFTNFGVFVELGEGLEGLCHISELSDERVDRPESVAELGQEMDFKILRIEPSEQKIGLSARAVGKDDQVTTGTGVGGDGGGGDKIYSAEAKGGMASLGELAKLRHGGEDQPVKEEDPEEKKRAKQAAKKAKTEEFAAREAQKSADSAGDEVTAGTSEASPEDSPTRGATAEEKPAEAAAETETTVTGTLETGAVPETPQTPADVTEAEAAAETSETPTDSTTPDSLGEPEPAAAESDAAPEAGSKETPAASDEAVKSSAEESPADETQAEANETANSEPVAESEPPAVADDSKSEAAAATDESDTSTATDEPVTADSTEEKPEESEKQSA